MQFDLLKKIRPDHYIHISHSNHCVINASSSISNLLQLNDVMLNLPLDEIINNSNNQYFNWEFISNLMGFTHNKKDAVALMLLNSGYISNKQIRGLVVYLVRLNHDNENYIELEFFNLISLTNMITGLFSNNIWDKFKNAIATNRHNFISRQLWLAYKAFLPFFILTNSSELNIQAKSKYEFGELLFYFNSYTRNQQISSSSGRNILTECLARSEVKLTESYKVDIKMNPDVLLGNSLIHNQFIILN